jgi:hypothetical protein
MIYVDVIVPHSRARCYVCCTFACRKCFLLAAYILLNVYACLFSVLARDGDLFFGKPCVPRVLDMHLSELLDFHWLWDQKRIAQPARVNVLGATQYAYISVR